MEDVTEPEPCLRRFPPLPGNVCVIKSVFFSYFKMYLEREDLVMKGPTSIFEGISKVSTARLLLQKRLWRVCHIQSLFSVLRLAL
jgi:hypothetical protein